jgi:sorting nexin-8
MPPIANQSRTPYLPCIDESAQEWQGGFKTARNPKKKVTFNTTKHVRACRESRQTRDAPFPNTILDRKALTKALGELNLIVENRHIDYFYEHFHRQNYPELDRFVEEYKKIFADHPSDVSISSDDNTTSPGSVGSRYRRHRLPTALLDFLSDTSNGFVTTTSTVVSIEKSPSGNTTKVGLALHDGLLIETHIMRYREHDAYHASVSVSSQVGCEAGCSFDHVSTMGLRGNLTSGEILEQVIHARRIFGEDNQGELHHRHVVQNVTFMGLGEPLHNYNHVVDACHLLANKRVWDLCHGRITIATIGVTPRIYDLTRDLPDVILAVGLHAPNQSLRRAIVPSAQEYPLDALMNALDNHNMKDPHDRGLASPSGRKRRMVMIEYIMSKLLR